MKVYCLSIFACFLYAQALEASYKPPFQIQVSSPVVDVVGNPGTPIESSGNGYIALLGAQQQEFKVVANEEIRNCGELACSICKNYDGNDDEECIECHSNTSSITLTGDLLTGVCDGRSFTRAGFVPNENSGIEKCENEETAEAATDRVLGPGIERFPVQWDNCYRQQKTRRYFQVGIVLTEKLIDNRFFGDVRKAKIWLSSIFAQSNLIYRYQLNIELELNGLFIGGEDKSLPDCEESWNEICTGQGCIGKRLNELRSWAACMEKAGRIDVNENGVWQIFDDIETAPGAGVAYVGALCSKSGFNVGVTSYSGGNIWRTFAHELGHNFNAIHPMVNDQVKRDNAGIMGYGDGKLDGEYQFDEMNRERVCGEVDEAIASCKAFRTSSAAQCGDGIVEGDEECECAIGIRECPCCKKCKLKGDCNPLDDVNGCCDEATCNFAPKETTCQDKAGYCNLGECLFTHPSLEICDVQGCRLGLKRRGRRNDACRLEGWRSATRSFHHMLDGIPCGRGGMGTCEAGQCSSTIVETARPTKKPTNAPTKKPTNAPTKKPTKKPTMKPTKKPTMKPTNKPTRRPRRRRRRRRRTRRPTNYPTKYPVQYPTEFPTMKSANSFEEEDSIIAPVDIKKYRKDVCGKKRSFGEALKTCQGYGLYLCDVEQYFRMYSGWGETKPVCPKPKEFGWVLKREVQHPALASELDVAKSRCSDTKHQIQYKYRTTELDCVAPRKRNEFACCTKKN